MRDEKHTPGPWIVRERKCGEGKERFIIRHHAYSYPPYDYAYAHARTIGDPRHASENAANAQLIAAAPELLEACRQFISAYYLYIDGEGTMDILDEASNVTRLAIAKAYDGVYYPKQPKQPKGDTP